MDNGAYIIGQITFLAIIAVLVYAGIKKIVGRKKH